MNILNALGIIIIIFGVFVFLDIFYLAKMTLNYFLGKRKKLRKSKIYYLSISIITVIIFLCMFFLSVYIGENCDNAELLEVRYKNLVFKDLFTFKLIRTFMISGVSLMAITILIGTLAERVLDIKKDTVKMCSMMFLLSTILVFIYSIIYTGYVLILY